MCRYAELTLKVRSNYRLSSELSKHELVGMYTWIACGEYGLQVQRCCKAMKVETAEQLISLYIIYSYYILISLNVGKSRSNIMCVFAKHTK